MQSSQLVARLLAAAFVSGIALTAGAAPAADTAPVAQAQTAGSTAADQADDAAIAAKVKAALKADPALSAVEIDVSSKDGVVALKGTVPTAEAATQALKLTAAVPGVKEVRNELKLPS